MNERSAALDALNEALVAAARHLNRLGFENSAHVMLDNETKLYFVPGCQLMQGAGLVVELADGSRHTVVGAKVQYRKLAAGMFEELFDALLEANPDDAETIQATLVAYRFAEGAFDKG